MAIFLCECASFFVGYLRRMEAGKFGHRGRLACSGINSGRGSHVFVNGIQRCSGRIWFGGAAELGCRSLYAVRFG